MILLFGARKPDVRRMALLGANSDAAAKADGAQRPIPSRTRPPSQQVAASKAHGNRLGPAAAPAERPRRSALRDLMIAIRKAMP